MRQVAKLLPHKPSSILVVSAHWESDPVEILASQQPSMLYDYSGFPPETYKYQYSAPGSPELARQIQSLLSDHNIPSKLNDKRGFDHGVFIPLMLMYPEADIPVVSLSLHTSLDAKFHLKLGEALAPLREQGVLIVGSGYTFHNMQAFFHPTSATFQASTNFNDWLKRVLVGIDRSEQLRDWHKAPGARISHPREEHLLPLLVTTAAAGDGKAKLIYETANKGDHDVSGWLFE
jgi:aromatic ring-opening dioxygenase catalytic subunit (LigB family)